MKRPIIVAMVLMLLIFASCNNKTKEKNLMNKDNPFIRISTLPYQAPDFSKIKSADFAPALEEGIKQQFAEIEQIANNNDEPTFENTLVAIEKSGELLTRAMYVFGILSSANTDEILQQLQEDIAPKLAALQDAIMLNDNLFERVKIIYQKRDELTLDK